MKTKSIMLIAVSLGFGLIAAIGMSQVLGQKSSDSGPKVEMVEVFVANKALEHGDELKLEENINVEKRPKTDVPDNAVLTKDDLANMVAIQKIPKGLYIVSDCIRDKSTANLSRQPPNGYDAFAFDTKVEDTLHNTLQPGDRVNVIGVFRFRNQFGDEVRAPKTFLKNIEVWQINNAHRISAEGEETKIQTISVLLTAKQCEMALLAKDIASVIQFTKTNKNVTSDTTEDFDINSLAGMNNNQPKQDEPETADDEPEEVVDETSESQKFIDELNAATKTDSQTTEPAKPKFKHTMTIYKGNQIIKYGKKDDESLFTVVEQTVSADNQQNPVEPTVTAEDDFSDQPSETESEQSEDNFPQQ